MLVHEAHKSSEENMDGTQGPCPLPQPRGVTAETGLLPGQLRGKEVPLRVRMGFSPSLPHFSGPSSDLPCISQLPETPRHIKHVERDCFLARGTWPFAPRL